MYPRLMNFLPAFRIKLPPNGLVDPSHQSNAQSMQGETALVPVAISEVNKRTGGSLWPRLRHSHWCKLSVIIGCLAVQLKTIRGPKAVNVS